MQTIPLASAALAVLLAAAPSAAAEVRSSPKAVLELFTSQGCSSCPGADAILSELGTHADVIALAYHVDYWDYIGWTDTFGNKSNSDRQKAYAQSWGSSRIYTPQLIVNGVEGVVGSRQKDVGKALDSARLGLPVEMSLNGDTVDVSIGPQANGEHAMVWLVTFKDHSAVAIERGENAGKTMDYTQIVTSRQMLGMWDAASGTHLMLPLSEIMAEGSNGAAIVVQVEKDGLPGRILGAASLQL